MRLGGLIAMLEGAPSDAEVVFDGGEQVPGTLRSWRGRYEDLTLTSGSGSPTVAELLRDALAADGATFEGYKGGEYVMHRDTPVWADEWGEYDGRMIVGAEMIFGVVVLRTLVRPLEYS